MLRALLLCLAVAAPAAAQSTGNPTRQPDDPNTRLVRTSEANQRLQKMIKLPQRAQEVRDKGVPAADMKEALEAARDKGVKAHDMADLTAEQSKAIDEHGRIDRFGAFVKSKLNEGLRGRELAQAIREEHARRGIGHHGRGQGPDNGKAKDRDKGQDRDDNAHEDHKAKPDNPGKGHGRGKP